MSEPSPYTEESTNSIYELLFCEALDSFWTTLKPPYEHPWGVLLSESPSVVDLQKIIMDTMLESRVRLFACHALKKLGQSPQERILLGVIVEIGLEEGLDVLAAYRDGSARYINYTGRILIWDTSDLQSALITKKIFDESEKIVAKIGPWNQPRRPAPTKDNLRISFLVSDGLYFGEGPVNTLFKDPTAAPALTAATSLLQYITDKVG